MNTRPYDYIAYIDESGDSGLRWVKPIDDKGSEWFILSAVVIRADNEPNVLPWVKEIVGKLESPQVRHLHFRKLKPDWRKLIVCKEMAKLPIRLFVFASNKKNMRRHHNRRAEAKGETLVGTFRNYNWFYYWSSRILLEKVTDFVLRDSTQRFGEPRKLRLEFSENKGLRYDEIKYYYQLLRMHSLKGTQYITTDDIEWAVMEQREPEMHNPRERAGLQLADSLASAFFLACDIHDTGGCEPKFARELAPRMTHLGDTPSGPIDGYGLKLMPSLRAANIEPAQQSIFRFYGYR